MGCEPRRKPKGEQQLGSRDLPSGSMPGPEGYKRSPHQALPSESLASCSHSHSQHLCERYGAATSFLLWPFSKGVSWVPCPSVHPGACLSACLHTLPLKLCRHPHPSAFPLPLVWKMGVGQWGCLRKGFQPKEAWGAPPQTTWRQAVERGWAVHGPGKSLEGPE